MTCAMYLSIWQAFFDPTGIQKGVNQKITQMEASSRSATEIAEQLKLQNDHLESENKSLKKKLSDQASQLRKFESGITTNGGTSTPASKSKSSAVKYALLRYKFKRGFEAYIKLLN